MIEDNAMADRWFSVDEIAEYLGVSRDTVYNWIAERGMPGRKVGRFWKFKKDAVDAWVESGGSDTMRAATARSVEADGNEGSSA